jgi:hypothetical protein
MEQIMKVVGLAFVVAAALSIAACEKSTTAAGGVTQVASTTSFGMCVGYCTTRLEISKEQAVLVREARGGRGSQDLPEQRIAAPLQAGEWEEIARLAAAAKIDGLPDVIGCPDCADGGAETLSIVGPARNKTIKFDHGANIAEAQPLLDRVRAVRTRMMPNP